MKDARPLLRVVLREEYVALTGDHRTAILLNQIEYWAHRTRDVDKFLIEEKKRAAGDDREVNANLTHGWIYKTAEELSSETMINLSVSNIRIHLQKLVRYGWISERNNPEHRWDRTKQYRFNALQVSKDLEAIGYHLDGWVFQEQSTAESTEPEKGHDSTISILENRDSDLENRTIENRNAIPETTTEITTEITHKQPSAAAADSPTPRSKRKSSSGVVAANTEANNPVAHDTQQLIEYAAAKGIGLKRSYADRYLSRAGGLAGAQAKVDEAVDFIDKERSRGKQIKNLIGVLEHVLRCDEDSVTLTRDPISDQQKRLKEKEAKYEDLYLS
jgi:hypothetical protein